MEIATLARIFPDRLLPGLGHGVQSWMAQVGAKAESPLTLLREHTDAIRALLHGQTVDTEGRYVKLSDVTLDWPPEQTPPVLLGAKGPKTIRLAGEVSDGAILEGSSTLDDIRKARELLTEGRAAGHLPGQPSIVAFSPVEPDAPDLPGQLRSQAAALAEAGADSVIFFSAADDNPAPEPIIEALAK
jgi:alkanesulfonate monooxygenase SsuD/methylene tetrahydromethanopterin reductase-like flavin-dependent oxidoreductase (luciferase family)